MQKNQATPFSKSLSLFFIPQKSRGAQVNILRHSIKKKIEAESPREPHQQKMAQELGGGF